MHQNHFHCRYAFSGDGANLERLPDLSRMRLCVAPVWSVFRTGEGAAQGVQTSTCQIKQNFHSEQLDWFI